MGVLQLQACLEKLYGAGLLSPVVVAAVHAHDRMQEYGTQLMPDYQGRGAKAGLYAQFVIRELLPLLRRDFPIREKSPFNGTAGFSLSGLMAFDLAWHYPRHFGLAGVFSGSLWWRSSQSLPHDPDMGRLVHRYVTRGEYRPHQRFWFQTGTLDEKEDRNHNGIIDAIDDTLDLIAILRKQGFSEQQIRYLEVEKGRHHPRTWAKVMPDFLRWAYGR